MNEIEKLAEILRDYCSDGQNHSHEEIAQAILDAGYLPVEAVVSSRDVDWMKWLMRRGLMVERIPYPYNSSRDNDANSLSPQFQEVQLEGLTDSLDEWYKIATKGTRGDMVYDILEDWKATIDKIKQQGKLYRLKEGK
ncbi:MAG: hypothetical protein PHQ86_06460 [Dehalococcoidales bacterium]|nr:hypothetical protein [Dehalococcoidales bacterium]